MPDKIVIASIEDLARHYDETHEWNILTEQAHIEEDTVYFAGNGKDIPITFCTLCGKKIIVSDPKIRFAKIIEDLKNTVLINCKDDSNSYTAKIFEILECAATQTNEAYISDTDLREINRLAIMATIVRDVNK